jgi:hypothetical protein
MQRGPESTRARNDSVRLPYPMLVALIMSNSGSPGLLRRSVDLTVYILFNGLMGQRNERAGTPGNERPVYVPFAFVVRALSSHDQII